MFDPAEILPLPLVAAWVALVGATVGSFLNVVIARVPAGQSIVRPGSRCPTCETPIRWYDNVPLVSWLVLRARCRACGTRISVRYPAVELLGMAAALLAFWHRGATAAALAEFVFACFLIALSGIDLDTWLLPHALTWPVIGLGLAASAAGLAPARSLAESALGAGVGFGAFAAVAVVGRWIARREALGFGDVWLLCGLGAWLGAPALLPVVLLASLQGTVVGIGLILAGRAQTGERPPPPGSLPGDSPVASEATRAEPRGEDPAPPAPMPGDADVPADEAPDPAAGEDEDWVPPRNAVPFGPFLALGALEWLYLGELLVRAAPALKVFR